MALIGLVLAFLSWFFIRAAKDVADADAYFYEKGIKQLKLLPFAGFALFGFGAITLAVLLAMIIREITRLF